MDIDNNKNNPETEPKIIIKKKNRQKIGEFEKIAILKLYYEDGFGYAEIAKKFNTTRQYIYGILKELKLKDKAAHNNTIIYDTTEILEKRKNMDVFDRRKLIAADALEVAELSIALAKFKVTQMLNAANALSNENENNSKIDKIDVTINIDKLTRLLQTALPYVLPKQSDKPKQPNKPINTYSMKLHKNMNKKIS